MADQIRSLLLVALVALVLLAAACGDLPPEVGAADPVTAADQDGAGQDGAGHDAGAVDGGASEDIGDDGGASADIGDDGVAGDGTTTAEEDPEMLEGDWYLVDAVGPGTEVLPSADRDITMSIEGGELAGSGGCNSYSAEYVLTGDRLTVGEIVRTEIACEPAGVMAAEQAYLDALGQVERAALDGEELVLSGAGRELRFAIMRLPTAPIEDGAG